MLTRIYLLLGILIFLPDIRAVLNGIIAEPGDFPYQVILEYKNSSSICSGSIISETQIVTAWHCVDNIKYEDIKIIAGVVKRNDPHRQVYSVADVRLHRERCKEPSSRRCYDIAVITTTEVIVYSKKVAKILPASSEMVEGTECSFSGWGITERSTGPSNNLIYKNGKTLDSDTCKVWLSEMHDYEFCFESLEKDGLTIDKGDSGGPFVCDGFLVGVMIGGGGDQRDPAVCMDVYQLLSFIDGTDNDSCSIFN